MISVRRSNERGHAERGWLKSFHTFSFADYYDPGFMGFQDLRVINEDFIAPAQGFPTHPHNDMEIITYVVKGELSHKDSLGNGAKIKPGEVQHMSAGTGIRHSEFNSRDDEETHLLQIWILPEAKGLKPGYGQKNFAGKLATEKLVLAVSRDGREGSISINQDVDLYVAKWSGAEELNFQVRDGRKYWLQLIAGDIKFNQTQLGPGDAGIAVDEKSLTVSSTGPAEFLLFDLN
jgi:redox-sensitive bicupin YhaK (pirin superfamily)